MVHSLLLLGRRRAEDDSGGSGRVLWRSEYGGGGDGFCKGGYFIDV